MPLPRPHSLSFIERVRAALVAALVLGAMLALAGCGIAEQSVNVNQQRIWSEYELKYDADADVTTARATFRFGNQFGTPLELTHPSEVRFAGELLSRRVQAGTGVVHYERTFAGAVSSGTFRFVDTEDEAYANTVSLRPIAFPDVIGPIDNDASFSLDWVGGSLASGEAVTVTLSRIATEDPAAGLFSQRQAGTHAVVLDRGQLQHVSPGDVRLQMERTFTGVPLDVPDAGGKLTLRWSARSRTATVVD